MSSLSQEEARTFIASVRKQNGGVTPEVRSFLNAHSLGLEALGSIQGLRRNHAALIKIVVDNLYSKETHFLYELIQNAEDNSYSITTADSNEPFLAFKLYSDRIIVDSNEDGFSNENISAICSAGESTKRHSAGYIGEKGIGFKSVFIIAKKVHVQSGPFSFAFSHTREDDDDGLGLITPYDEDAEELPVDIRTRMTLTLLDSTKFEELATEFRDLPDTLLMFLNQLKRISIDLNPPGDVPTTIRYTKRETSKDGLYTTSLTKTTRTHEKELMSNTRYYTMKSELHKLPFDKLRMDKKGKSIDRATVVLAFPVDEHDEPILEPQYTYAFLPLRKEGFKFLIQADFITQANREGVVDSERNQAILEGVASAFADAMVKFCKHPSLRYRWMRYLPENSTTREFWGLLWVKVREKLQSIPLLESWSGNGLYKPPNLQKLTERVIAEDGTPLLPDLKEAEIYLSRKYTEADFHILERLGTKTIQWTKFNDRLEADLSLAEDSRWKDLKRAADWRTRTCTCISRFFRHPYLLVEQDRLRSFALIPMRDGKWKSSASGIKLFFSRTDDVPIPADIGLNLVHHLAMANPAWVHLLEILGVSTCSSDDVVSSIYKRYNTANVDDFKVSNGVAHVRYLYWFLPKEISKVAPQVRLANQYRSLTRNDQYLYFPDGDDEYSPARLLQPHLQFSGCPVNYLNEAYLDAVKPDVFCNGLTWRVWLEEKVGVRSIPELCAQGQDGLSKEFKYIVDHRSDKLLGTLKRGWKTYRLQLKDGVGRELREIPILLEDGRRKSLQSGFLPLPKLKKVAAELGIAKSYPFIAVADILRDDERTDWIFAKDLQVGVDDSLQFYLTALDTFETVNSVVKTTSTREKLAKIYESIQLKCNEGLDQVQNVFTQPSILAPPSEKSDATWVGAADCVWDGPQWLKSKHRLNCETYLQFEHLFKVALKIPDASQTDVVHDLLMLKSQTAFKKHAENQPLNFARPKLGTIGVGFKFNLIKEDTNHDARFQSINSMKLYEDQSFEELRLTDNGWKKAPSDSVISASHSKVFSGTEPNQVTEEAEKRYDFLWVKQLFKSADENSKTIEALRTTFEDSALVYAPKEKAWFSPSQCVWIESNVKISFKASIADAYPLKSAFFKNVLKISEPTVEMYVESLASAPTTQMPLRQIKVTMALICGLGIGETNLSSLIEAKILPITLKSGLSSFASASPNNESLDFAIAENTIHWSAFKGKIRLLDFTLEEIRDTRPLLLAMGLEKRMSSQLVREVTDVNGGSQDGRMTQKICMKSEAIARCGFHFATLDERQDVASLYRKFKRATVYASDNIRLSMRILQDGRSIEGASSRANFHLEETEGTLRLYLPKDEVERDVCFESDLPRRVCRFLNIADPGALAVVGAVFRKDNPAVIAKILKNAGVGLVDCDFAALDRQLGMPEIGLEDEDLANATSSSILATPSPGPRAFTPSSLPRQRDWQLGSANVETVQTEHVLNPLYQQQQTDAQDRAYRKILENAVKVARQRVKAGVVESIEPYTPGFLATQEALPEATLREAFANRTQERDFKVGAAGELYIFEYLKGLDLPGFGLLCWTSAIRDRVKIHPDYRDLVKSNDRRAIADLEYVDTSGKLTKLLIKKGHLNERAWASERPFYHIEVKTTTSADWQEPFFMSKAQEQHIQDKRIEDGTSRTDVYVICRLFNLGKGDDTGMHIYLDPETRRRNGDLEFSTHTWAVKPLKHPIMPGWYASRASAAQPAATAPETPSSTETKEAREEPTVSEPSILSRSASSHVQSSSGGLSGPSTSGAQTVKEAAGKSRDGLHTSTSNDNKSNRTPPGSGLFASKLPSLTASLVSSETSQVGARTSTSDDNASSKSPPGSDLFGSKIPPSTQSLSSNLNSVSSNSDTSKSPPVGPASSNTTPKAGLFGSDAPSIRRSVSPNSRPSKSPSSSLFSSSIDPSQNETARSPSPMRNLFDFTSDGTPPNREASKSPSPGIFISNAGSSTPPSRRLIGSKPRSPKGHTPRAVSTGSIFVKSPNKDVSEVTVAGGSGLFGLDSSSSTPKAPTVSLFGTPLSKDESKDTPPSASGLFGLASSGSDTSKTSAVSLSGSLASKDASKDPFPSASYFGTGFGTGSGTGSGTGFATGFSSTNTAKGPVTAGFFTNIDKTQTQSKSGLFGTRAVTPSNEDSTSSPPTFSFGTSPFATSSDNTPKTASAEGLEASVGASSNSKSIQTPRANSPFDTKPVTPSSKAPEPITSSSLFSSPLSPASTGGVVRTPSPLAQTDSAIGTKPTSDPSASSRGTVGSSGPLSGTLPSPSSGMPGVEPSPAASPVLFARATPAQMAGRTVFSSSESGAMTISTPQNAPFGKSALTSTRSTSGSATAQSDSENVRESLFGNFGASVAAQQKDLPDDISRVGDSKASADQSTSPPAPLVSRTLNPQEEEAGKSNSPEPVVDKDKEYS